MTELESNVNKLILDKFTGKKDVAGNDYVLHLYAVAEEESLGKSSTSKIWPKLTKQDLIISPEIMDLVRDVEPASVDFDADAARLEYLMKKHG